MTVPWLTLLADNPTAAIIWQEPEEPVRSAPTQSMPQASPYYIPHTFGTPAEPTSGDCRWISRRLRWRPKRWAIVYAGNEYAAQRIQRNITRGSLGFLYAGGYESATRYVDGQTVVYARYIGWG